MRAFDWDSSNLLAISPLYSCFIPPRSVLRSVTFFTPLSLCWVINITIFFALLWHHHRHLNDEDVPNLFQTDHFAYLCGLLFVTLFAPINEVSTSHTLRTVSHHHTKLVLAISHENPHLSGLDTVISPLQGLFNSFVHLGFQIANT